jgi:hypothetical protein
MDLEETKARNDCAGEGQQEFNPPTEKPAKLMSELESGLKAPRPARE